MRHFAMCTLVKKEYTTLKLIPSTRLDLIPPSHRYPAKSMRGLLPQSQLKTLSQRNKLNSQIIELIEGFEKNPSAELVVIQQVVRTLNLDLPLEYLDLFSFMNGGEGFIGDNYCRLYAIEDLMPLNEAFLVKEFAPELLIFGSNGGGEAFAFNTSSSPFSIVAIPFIPMDIKWAKSLGKTINEFFFHFSNSADNRVKNIPPSINNTLIGKGIHEIQPVVFGGDPVDPKNKIPLSPKDYAKLVVFWNKIWQNRTHQEVITT